MMKKQYKKGIDLNLASQSTICSHTSAKKEIVTRKTVFCFDLVFIAINNSKQEEESMLCINHQ